MPPPPSSRGGTAGGLSSGVLPAARVLRPMPARRRSFTPVVVVSTAAAVAGIAALTWAVYPRTSTVVMPTLTPVPPPASGTDAGDGVLDPSDLLVKAKVDALKWDPNATLVRIVAASVAGGVVDKVGGSVTYVFGKPAGAKLGPGAPLDLDRFVLRVDREGFHGHRESSPERAVGLAEPGCSFSDAWASIVASGVPSNETLTLVYGESSRHGRAVWEIEEPVDPKLQRSLDGQSCAILTR